MLDLALAQIGELQPYDASVYRIVETQEYAATTSLVDDLDEQSLLESMLEEAKPSYRQGTEHLHYLISTPFRYPPLRYGSRFGDRTMPSYFYASESSKTSLTECAYYRLAFFDAMSEPYSGTVISEHSMFCVKAKTESMANATSVSDESVLRALISANDYSFTQSLGKSLVKAGVDIIRFYSARDEMGINVAISNPKAIVSKTPFNNKNWICQTSAEKVSFNCHSEEVITFLKSSFYHEGAFPSLP